MKITYICHSGFLIEFDRIVLLFDYYRGKLPALPEGKPLYVFASHKHPDHLNFRIFNLTDSGKTPPFYFLGSDIHMNSSYMERKQIPPAARERIRFVKKEERFQIDTPDNTPLLIETIPSTDAGVAFLVLWKGKRIYHAGDLNWWSFPGDEEAAARDMERRFLREMEKLKGMHFDAAFLPLDPRQEDRFSWGFDSFMRVTDTKMAFPMHFWEDYSVIPRLRALPESKPYRSRIAGITRPGQTFVLDV